MSEETPNVPTEEEKVAPIAPVELAEAESKTGIKDGAVNQDAIDADGKKEEGDEPEEEHFPSFFIEPDDRIRIEIDVLYDKSDGDLVSVSRTGLLNLDDFKTLGFSKEWFEFSIATYEDMSGYRQRCSVFRRDANRLLTDPLALRNHLLVWHLKDWSLKGRDGEKIDIGHNDEGALDKKSVSAVNKLNATLLDVVVTLFEKDMRM